MTLTAKSPATFYMKKNTEDDIREAEKILCMKIHNDLSDFYINVNIMVYPYNTYSMNGEKYHIYRFESLFDYISIRERGERNIGGLISTSLEISKDPDFPINKGLFFAISDFGDLFYVSADEETFGNVFYFPIETQNDGEENKPVFLSENFSTFFNNLEASEESMADYIRTCGAADREL